MKKSFILPLFFLLLLSACKDDEPDPETRMIVEVKKQQQSSSGSITTEKSQAIIHVWEAENREFDVAASPDIYLGNIYDKTSETFKTLEYGAIGSRMSEKVEPGRYFIYILLPKSSGNGSLAYTYTYFTIKEGETLKLEKTFGFDLAEGSFEKWDKNK
ncbi:hypothetical protein ACSX1A_04215 [Pontibacter sp. MBLB2868]|uniref:hypothetical protein n=1 Tax=Pontibacter sp. MBLB2868 TaxID=3451555 RepID=UPI003F7533E7